MVLKKYFDCHIHFISAYTPKILNNNSIVQKLYEDYILCYNTLNGIFGIFRTSINYWICYQNEILKYKIKDEQYTLNKLWIISVNSLCYFGLLLMQWIHIIVSYCLRILNNKVSNTVKAAY